MSQAQYRQYTDRAEENAKAISVGTKDRALIYAILALAEALNGLVTK